MVTRRGQVPLLPSVRGAFGLALSLTLSCTPPTGTPDDAPLAVPFTVSDYFSPTGYMGDGTAIGVVNMVAAACPTRAPDAIGDCYTVTYTPPAASADRWAGVYWQYPGNNWGGYFGHTVRPGATRVTLWARGAKGGEQLSFKVGGIATADDTVPYHDSLSISAPAMTLTTSWQELTIDFNGATYDEVLGGFAWIVNLPPLTGAPSDNAPVVFYLDAIRWSP